MSESFLSNSKLPDGWIREVRIRKSGKTAGKMDVYFYSPDRQMFRSKKSLLQFLKHTNSPLQIDCFNFNVSEKDSGLILTEKMVDKSFAKSCINNENVCEEYPSESNYAKATQGEKIIFNSKSEEPCVENYCLDSSFTEIKSGQSSMNESFTQTSQSLEPCEECIKLPHLKNNHLEKCVEQPHQKLIRKKTSDLLHKNSLLPKRSHYFKFKNISCQESIPNYFRTNPKWNPPRSPFNLMQEDLYHDPWKMLVATICLQKTTGKAVKNVLSQLFERFPTPNALLKSQPGEISSILQTLGLQEKRAKMLLRFSDEFINKKWKYPIELYGIGKYGNDSYRIFCVNEWKQVTPKDHMLEKYHQWLVTQWNQPSNVKKQLS